MRISKFKIQNSKFANGSRWLMVGVVLFLVLTGNTLRVSVTAHGGEDHSKDAKTTVAAPVDSQPESIVTAERNLETNVGNFSLLMKRSPGDPRTSETQQFLIKIAETVEGGFGGGGPVPTESATVLAKITEAGGKPIAENLPVTAEAEGIYRTNYDFSSAGNFKIVFDVTTADNRQFSVDFPVTVTKSPIRSSFWIGLTILCLLTLALLGSVFYVSRENESGKLKYKKAVPFGIAALSLFVFGVFVLMYLIPPRETRAATAISPEAMSESAVNSLDSAQTIHVTKESQLLFGIKTEAVSTRNITAGLKVTGTVKARPDARAVITPPVAGRIVLREGLTLGSAVGRGESIGYVEQVLDVAGQVGLEQQRLDVEAQQREVEARRLEIKNTVLQLQAQQADQRAFAQQARARLAQAQRELRRSENLVEVNAVPKKRLEEASTAVKVAELEVESADKQVALIENQIKQTNAGQNIFKNPRVNQPKKTFPLTAPVTGTITEIKATSGQQVEAGTEILSIVNLNTVLIEAQVFERDLPAMRDSTRASFTNAALGGEVYTIGTADGDGRLVSIGQTVDPQTRTVPVIYEMINPLNRLRDGMFVDITVDTSGDRKVLAVSKQAVITEQGQTFVFVFDGGETFERRPVSIGAEGADFYEIKSGLKEGERVVTEGIYQLRSTQPGE